MTILSLLLELFFPTKLRNPIEVYRDELLHALDKVKDQCSGKQIQFDRCYNDHARRTVKKIFKSMEHDPQFSSVLDVQQEDDSTLENSFVIAIFSGLLAVALLTLIFRSQLLKSAQGRRVARIRARLQKSKVKPTILFVPADGSSASAVQICAAFQTTASTHCWEVVCESAPCATTSPREIILRDTDGCNTREPPDLVVLTIGIKADGRFDAAACFEEASQEISSSSSPRIVKVVGAQISSSRRDTSLSNIFFVEAGNIVLDHVFTKEASVAIGEALTEPLGA